MGVVLKEIDKMLELIEEEKKADKEKKAQILSLEGEIDTLTKTIEDPTTGLKAQIDETEVLLETNKEAQTTETKDRLEENVAYQKDVKNLVQAESILKKAIKVLKAYYEDLEKKLAAGEALVQEDPKPPEAWKGHGAYAGQSGRGG